MTAVLAEDRSAAPEAPAPALALDDVQVDVRRDGAWTTAVTGVSLSVDAGDSLGVVGESGCGKSLTLRAAIGLLPPGARVSGGGVRGPGEPSAGGRRGRRGRAGSGLAGRGVAMVFQDPLGALNPTRRVGDLVADGVRLHQGVSRAVAARRALELLADVGVPEPRRRARMWPHELSGGLRQRVMIAMALSTDPDVLLCDEPTTALDVTVQDQILGLLDRLRRERGMALVFVSHDLAVVASVCRRIAVLYAGQVVEEGTVEEVLGSPRHAYTRALLASGVDVDARVEDFVPIPGQPPDPAAFGTGCRFADRCRHALERCVETPYALRETGPGRRSSCVRADELDLLDGVGA